MTFAWYGHLKFPTRPLWIVILASSGLAFFEYCLMVPANRIGYGTPESPGPFNAAQLKTIQEIITLVVFAGFSWLSLGEKFRWNHGVAFLFLIAAAYFMFRKFQIAVLGSVCTLPIDRRAVKHSSHAALTQSDHSHASPRLR